MKLVILPVEPYEERTGAQILNWFAARAIERGITPIVVDPGKTVRGQGDIQVGVVLDAFSRADYSCRQVAMLVDMLAHKKVGKGDVIYLQDFFTPGYEALPYCFDQMPQEDCPRVYAMLHAQSVDPDDFTYPMLRWMRHFELMADETMSGVFVASEIHKEMLRTAGFKMPVHVVGLPFNLDEVRDRSQGQWQKPWKDRERRVLFTSRWDKEKQPWFFLELAKRASQDPRLDSVEFAVSTSAPSLRSNLPEMVQRAREAEQAGYLRIYEGLTKAAYYSLLCDTQVHFNCARQDFVSYSMLEASALGTPTIAPCFRAFPEALDANPLKLYTPWSLEDAASKIDVLLSQYARNPNRYDVDFPACHHHQTIDRELDIMLDPRAICYE